MIVFSRKFQYPDTNDLFHVVKAYFMLTITELLHWEDILLACYSTTIRKFHTLPTLQRSIPGTIIVDTPGLRGKLYATLYS
jgi:hypothetical protein